MNNRICAVKYKNLRTGEVWVCDDHTNKKTVDGDVFIEVHSEHSTRKVWVLLSALAKVKDGT